jgi:hypothetical protein
MLMEVTKKSSKVVVAFARLLLSWDLNAIQRAQLVKNCEEATGRYMRPIL